MNNFVLQIFDSRKSLRLADVTSFIGQDGSGSFGILPGHARMMTVLVLGLARYRCAEKPWQYLAMTGAVLYFADNVLSLSCRHYLIDEDYERISTRLSAELVAEERQLREVRLSLKSMEEALLKQMWEMQRQGMKLS